jgi:hypothetical protein
VNFKGEERMQMKKFLMLGLLVLQVVGCTRAAKDTSAKITVELPQSSSSSATLQLSHVAINVTGAGITAPVVFSWDSCQGCSTASTTPESFQLEIPSGTGRLVQLLAVYKDSVTSQMVFYYGDSTADLTGGELALNVAISQVGAGNVTSGRVSGRFLETATTGPTGLVDVKYNPGNGKPALIVDQAAIVNGWFSLFMLSGANLQYVLRNNGTMLWGKEMSLDDSEMNPSENAGAYFDRRVRAFIPIHIRTQTQNSTTTYVAENAETYVWGYWGAGATGKKVCTFGLDSSPVPTKIKKYVSSNLSSAPSFSVSHFINHSLTVPTKAQLSDTTTPYSTIVVEGGANMSSSCAGFADTATNQYENFQKVYLDLFDGNGGDSVAGFRGIFRGTVSSNSSSSFVTVSAGDPRVLSGQVLPGVASVFSKLRLFKRAGTEDLHMDTANCSDIASKGFIPGSASDASFDSTGNFSLTSTISAAEATSGVSAVICPLDIAGTLLDTGVFLGKWNFSSGGGGGGGAPAKVTFDNLVAVTTNQCGAVRVGLLTSSDTSAVAASSMSVSLTTTSGSYYASNDYACAGSAISSVNINSGSTGETLYFKTAGTPETNITLTPTVSSPALTSVPKVVRIRSVANVAGLYFNTTTSAVNVGTCLPMTVSTVETNGTPVTSYNGAVTVTSSGATIYTNAGCSISGALNFVSGVAQFYIKGTSAGWSSLQASATIDSLNFVANYGIGVYAANEPTHMVMTDPGPNYLFINQCMPITVTAKNDSNVASAVPSTQTIKFTPTGGGGGNNFYTNATCTSSMVNYETTITSGADHVDIYFKPQNTGTVTIDANINGSNYYLYGSHSYSIANLWMHVIISGFNAYWFDTSC